MELSSKALVQFNPSATIGDGGREGGREEGRERRRERGKEGRREGRVIESFQLTESNEVNIMQDDHDDDSYGDL